MDPQQRILLEVAVDAFFSAGILPQGIFVGISNVDYARNDSPRFGLRPATPLQWLPVGYLTF